MREPLDLQELYGEAFLRGVAEGARLAERVARQAYQRHFARDRRPLRTILGEEPAAATGRSAYHFKKRLFEYLIDKGDLLLQEDGTLVASPELSVPIGDEPVEEPSCQGYLLLTQLTDVVDAVLSGTDGFQAIGQKYGMEAALEHWSSAMVELPVRVPGIAMTARALLQRLERGPCVVLEGGAGVGAVLRHALSMPRFRTAITNIEQYYFTEISPLLLNIGKKWLRANAPPELTRRMRFEIHDLDRTVLQALPYTRDESVDVIILEYVLYDVIDLHEVLTTFRRMLRPGGRLIFTMAHRQRPALFFPAEILQSTLHSFYRAKLDPPRRVNYGYLTLEEWQLSLRDAGFQEYHVYPEAERHPELLFGGIVAFT
ncbi:class I SAM-dependent methyltransferase [Pendulispora rubella]|uniref:Class I SAM-dependent methyltransferase n=1 Tax=Pendulispora rubella TaxID=2741070 RepID=A0ABZ2LFV1_9BACT